MSAAIQWTTVGMVAAWYGSNIGVLLLNKYLLTNYGFRFPIFLTLCHMTACSVLSYVAIAVMKVAPLQSVKSKVQFAKISGLSVVFCFSVVCGNVSLKYLPVSFNQAVGATTPFFTAVFSFLIIKKREASLTYAALIPVVAGVIVASGGEPSFHLFGFVMCITATAARAFKSVLQEILLSSDGEKLNSMNLLLYMAPIAVAFLLPATLLMEQNVVGITIELARKDIKLIWYLLFNSSLAYFVNLTNFLVTKHTSALTLQVLGNAKGAVAVVVSILIFKNPVSFIGMVGYALTVLGVILYSEAKKSYAVIVLMEVVPLQRVTSKVQLAKIPGLSAVFCFCVVCGNVSLKYLPVSFNESVGATTTFFTAVFTFSIMKKREALLTYTALIPVVTGVIIASGGEPSFHIFGFIMCITATGARAFKSVLQEILLSSEG
ncbi:sugar phosphate/phosphate translocator [Pyrus ussuriensis x Pyrus communis]|uniref:Sugar phosphate/phosphate translocator n=1 Tax=Pyrus ussuriensis x Pyrus communis TaxID=2448454 RepID=A0A5N5H282_9ROSA|nr:sugar phosphate/phosphate translocator [Pyrus ussuriensis x Pyrus communis]